MYRMRVALVHDYFTQLGGAERGVAGLHAVPQPAIGAASVVGRPLLPPALAGRAIRSSRLQPLLRAGAPLASLAPLLPAAFEGLRLEGVDLVVSSTSAFAHHARPPRGARHLAYVHTAARFIWQTGEDFREPRARGPRNPGGGRGRRRPADRCGGLPAGGGAVGSLPGRRPPPTVQAPRPGDRGRGPDRGGARRHRQRAGSRAPAADRRAGRPVPGAPPRRGRGAGHGRLRRPPLPPPPPL